MSNEINIHNNFMLASLTVRTWQASKTDKNTSSEVNASKNAASNASRVVKNLLAGCDGKLKAAQSGYNAARLWFYANSSPWGAGDDRRGSRLVPAIDTIKFMTEFARLKAAANVVLNEFLPDYLGAVQSARLTLGDMYDESEYPTEDQVRKQFAMVMTIEPLPAATAYSQVNLPGTVVKMLQDKYEQRLQAQAEDAVGDIQGRILAEVNRMATQLNKVASGEKTRLYETMTSNLRQMVGLARSFAPLDPKLGVLAARVEDELLQHEVKDYKDDMTLSRRVAAAATKVAAEISGPVDFDEDAIFNIGEL